MDKLFQDQDTDTDPVCKMTVSKANPPGGTAEHEGKTYYFCSGGCQRMFAAEPTKYL
jgi:YHS domain-containing protein